MATKEMTKSKDYIDDYIILKDKRKLQYIILGNEEGVPLFFFHGWPGSRLFLLPVLEEIKSLNVKVICPDRPGMGLSDFKKNRTLLDFADDVKQLADYLNIDQFSVFGHSAGGPYTIACAYVMPERIKSAGLVSSFAPIHSKSEMKGLMKANKIIFSLAKKNHFLHNLMIFFLVQGGVDRLIKNMSKPLPETDKEILSNIPDIKKDIEESFKGGYKGLALDQQVIISDWQIDFGKLDTQFYLWQGKKDIMITYEMSKYLSDNIRNCKTKLYDDYGHFFIFPKIKEILEQLVNTGKT